MMTGVGNSLTAVGNGHRGATTNPLRLSMERRTRTGALFSVVAQPFQDWLNFGGSNQGLARSPVPQRSTLICASLSGLTNRAGTQRLKTEETAEAVKAGLARRCTPLKRDVNESGERNLRDLRDRKAL